MKKKYRRAVCILLSTIVDWLCYPFETVSYLLPLLCDKLYDFADWLEDKLKIYDPD